VSGDGDLQAKTDGRRRRNGGRLRSDRGRLPLARPASDSGDPQSRVAVWIACILFVAAWLLICVGRLAGHRFFTPEDIDGGGVAGNSPKAALLQALLQNTLEQTVLAMVAYAAWLWLAPPERLGLVIVFSAYFAVGRILFFVGYSYGAPARALGFTLTFYPNVGLFLACLPEAVGRLANPG
jgi:hypothetical protein